MKRTLTTVAAAAAAFIAGAFIVPVTAHGPESEEGLGKAPHHEVRGERAPRAERPGRSRGLAGFDFAPRPPRHSHEGPEGAPAPPPPHGPDAKAMFPFWHNDSVAEKLGLSEEQVQGLEESWQLTRDALESTKGSLLEAGEAMREELEKDSPNLDTVYALSDATTAAASEKKKIVLGHMVTVKNILSAEQETTLKEGARRFLRERRGDAKDIRREVRQILEEDGTIEDVEALLTEKGIDGRVRDMVLERIEARLNGTEAPRAERGERSRFPRKMRDKARRGPDAETVAPEADTDSQAE